MTLVSPLADSVSSLAESAASERAGERVGRRLADVRALLGTDLAWVEEELARAARVGLSPATDSATHLLAAGGKRVRPLTVLLAAACFGAIPRAARELAVVAELVHLATLLHDDVIDDGQERRGQPTSRRIWGNAVSVLAGDLLLTHALDRTARTSAPLALEELLATLRSLVDGEVVQLRGRAALDLREETYFRVVKGKTASLFVWAARSGARASGGTGAAVDALGAFGEHIGLAFQLVDDALDYAGDADAMGKSLLADFREGKLTLPLIRAIAKRPELEEDVKILRHGGEDEGAAAERLARAVRSSGACEETRALARAETERAVGALAHLPPSPARELLGAVAGELAARVA